MILVGAADPLDPLHRRLVADMATQRVTRISRINNEPAAIDNRHGLLDQTALRIIRMNFEKLGHEGIEVARPAIIQDFIGKKTTFEKIIKIKALDRLVQQGPRKTSDLCYIYATKYENVVFFQKIGLLLSSI